MVVAVEEVVVGAAITDEGEEVEGIPRALDAHDEKIQRETEKTRKVKKARKTKRASLKEETVVVAEAVSEADVVVVVVDSAVVEVDTIDRDAEAAEEVVDDPSVRAMEERTTARAKAREMKNEANEVHLAAVEEEEEEVVDGAPVVVVAVDAATLDVSTEVVVVVEVVVHLGPKVAGVVNNPVTATRITKELMKAQHNNKEERTPSIIEATTMN